MQIPPAKVTVGMPVPTDGAWFACCGVWIFVPADVTDAALWRAARQLQALALEPESLCAEPANSRESL
jgi:hypothetical protein